MKKLRLIILILLGIVKLNGQVSFCPPGSQWTYSFLHWPQWFGIFTYQNETVTHVGDSIVGSDTIKILAHRRYYLSCDDPDNPTVYTSIKQKGDTIYFRNAKTQNSWQILYNFACTPGTGWQTTILNGFNQPITYGFTVDSVKYETYNGMPLKVLVIGNQKITERFGWNSFLFNFNSNMDCDGFYFSDFLCYKDDNFNTHLFTSRPCDFSGVDGLSEYTNAQRLKISPNPAVEYINIEFRSASSNAFSCEVKVVDVSGREVFTASYEPMSTEIQVPVGELKEGVYFVHLFQNNALIGINKLFKQ